MRCKAKQQKINTDDEITLHIKSVTYLQQKINSFWSGNFIHLILQRSGKNFETRGIRMVIQFQPTLTIGENIHVHQTGTINATAAYYYFTYFL